MPEISKDIILLIQYLAPGFISAWIYYGITSHVRPSSFERVVQATIFAIFIQIITEVIYYFALQVGRFWSIGSWKESSSLIISVTASILLGFLLALISNNDKLHSRFRKLGLSNRSSHPSEWHAVLKDNPAYMVFHLQDERRLVGYPLVWPSNHETGHFFISNCYWLVEDDLEDSESQEQNHIPIDYALGILINSSDIKMIEIMKEGESNEHHF